MPEKAIFLKKKNGNSMENANLCVGLCKKKQVKKGQQKGFLDDDEQFFFFFVI